MEKAFYMDFNEDKTINAVLYIVSKIKRRDFYKIFKILYFSDRDHLSQYGRTITGDSYIAMEDGPVPSKLYDIFKSVRGDGYFKDEGKFSKFFNVQDWDLITPNQNANLKTLSKTDITLIEQNIAKYGEMSWDELREKSHDYAWHHTAPNRKMLFEDLIAETGTDSSFAEYAKEQSLIHRLVR